MNLTFRLLYTAGMQPLSSLNYLKKCQIGHAGVFHCFGGTVERSIRINVMGDYYYGIGGGVTFKNGGLAEKYILISKQN